MNLPKQFVRLAIQFWPSFSHLDPSLPGHNKIVLSWLSVTKLFSLSKNLDPSHQMNRL